MMSRGTAFPDSSWRYPVSITCCIKVLISMMSPRWALGGTLINARAMISALHAGGEGDDHFHAAGPQRAVAQLGDSDDFLGVGEADAGCGGGAAGTRAEMEYGHMRLRVLLVEDMHRLDVIGFGHRAL